MKGRVVFFNNTYGFIRGEDEKDYYVNFNSIDEKDSENGYKILYTGQSVWFNPAGENTAENVKVYKPGKDEDVTCCISAYKMNDGEYIHSYNVYSEIFKKLKNGIRFVVYKDGYLIGIDTILPREDLTSILSRLDKSDFRRNKGKTVKINNQLSVKIV